MRKSLSWNEGTSFLRKIRLETSLQASINPLALGRYINNNNNNNNVICITIIDKNAKRNKPW